MFQNKKVVNLLSEMFGFPRKFGHGMVEVEFNCVKCDNGRNKFNMVVNTDNHVFHCWACGYKGKVDKLFSDYGNDRQKGEWSSIDKYSYTKDVEKPKESINLTGFRSLKVEWNDSFTYTAAMNVLKSRKITADLISKWDICYAENGKYANRIIVPSRNLNGKMEYFVARDIYDTQKMKYKNPQIEKSSIIFGEKFIDWKKPVILTEGVFDAMVLYNSVPLLGSKISEHKKLIQKIWDNKTPIILGFDTDKTGKDANMKIGKFLLNLKIPVYTIQDNMYNDLSKAYEIGGKDYIIKLIKNSKPFDELDLLINDLGNGINENKIYGVFK